MLVINMKIDKSKKEELAAIAVVLKAEKEPVLRGNLDELAKIDPCMKSKHN